MTSIKKLNPLVFSRIFWNQPQRFFRPFTPLSKEPPIAPPSYEGETEDVKKSRLLYQSRKRGMLENDLILSTFAHKYLKDLQGKMLDDYDILINSALNDWDIYYWATGAKPVPPEFNNSVMKKLQDHVKNINKEQRLRQPNLEPKG